MEIVKHKLHQRLLYFSKIGKLDHFIKIFHAFLQVFFFCQLQTIEFEKYKRSTMSNVSLDLKNRSHLLTLKIKSTISAVPNNEYLATKAKFEYITNIENGLNSAMSYHRSRQIATIINIIVFINAFSLFSYYELDNTRKQNSSLWLQIAYAIHLFCTLLFVLDITIHYENLNRMEKSDYNYVKPIFKIVCFLLLHPVPWMNDITVSISYDDPTFQNDQFQCKINYILLIGTFFKVIIVFLRNLLTNSIYLRPRALRIKKLYSVSVQQAVYAIRCIFRDIPIKMFLTFFIFGLTFFSISIKIIESNVPIDSNPFRHYQNCFWYVIITTTTVGYGQIRVFTHIGYIITIFSMIFGSMCISSILFILNNTLTLNSKEAEGLIALKRVESQVLYKQKCKLYIRTTLWRLWKNYKYNIKVKQTVKERKLRHLIGIIRKETKLYNSTGNIAELSQRQFDAAISNTDYLRQNNNQLLSFISDHIFSEELYRDFRGRHMQGENGDSSPNENEPNEMVPQIKVPSHKILRGQEAKKQIKIKTLKQVAAYSESQISELQPEVLKKFG